MKVSILEIKLIRIRVKKRFIGNLTRALSGLIIKLAIS